MKFTALLFDADETLFDFQKAEAAALRGALTGSGFSFSKDILEVYSAINQALWKQLEKGEVTREFLKTARFERLLSHMGLPGDPETLCESYADHLSRCDFLLPDALEVCKALSRSYRLYLITNGISRVQHGRFEKSAVRPCFSGIFVSEDLGSVKPEKAYFDRVTAGLGEKRENLLVIGDSLTSDIKGANNAGLACCWFNPGNAPKDAGIRCDYEIAALPELYGILGVTP